MLKKQTRLDLPHLEKQSDGTWAVTILLQIPAPWEIKHFPVRKCICVRVRSTLAQWLLWPRQVLPDILQGSTEDTYSMKPSRLLFTLWPIHLILLSAVYYYWIDSLVYSPISLIDKVLGRRKKSFSSCLNTTNIYFLFMQMLMLFAGAGWEVLESFPQDVGFLILWLHLLNQVLPRLQHGRESAEVAASS